MRLRSIELENFKCFSSPVRILLAPITLIFGPNSSGKSSILQALYLLMQTRRFGDPSVPLLFRADRGYADLGSFAATIHNHEVQNRRIGIRLEVDFKPPHFVSEEHGRWFSSVPAETMALKLYFSHGDQDKTVMGAFDFYVGNDCDPLARFEASAQQAQNAEASGPQSFVCTHLSTDPKYWEAYYDSYLKAVEEDASRQLPSRDSFIAGLQRLHSSFSIGGTEYFLPGHVCSEREKWESYPVEVWNAPWVVGKEEEDDPDYYQRQAIPGLDPANLSLVCAYQVDDALSKFVALGSMRSQPERWYLHSGSKWDSVGQSGEKTAEMLFRWPSLVHEVNQWLDELDTGYHVEIKPITVSYASMFEISFRDLSRPQAPPVGFPDVGFGISQILPIVVQGCSGYGKTILIEQPETHIHPALQARLGTFFAKCVKEHKAESFVIETHSEHLILRLQRLIRQGDLSPDDLSIIYVSRGPQGATVKRMCLDENGEFVDDWPGGFFLERLREYLD